MPRKKQPEHRNSWTNPPEKITCLTLQIRKDRKNKALIKNLDLNKLQALDNYHRINNQKPSWKLSEDKTKLLLT